MFYLMFFHPCIIKMIHSQFIFHLFPELNLLFNINMNKLNQYFYEHGNLQEWHCNRMYILSGLHVQYYVNYTDGRFIRSENVDSGLYSLKRHNFRRGLNLALCTDLVDPFAYCQTSTCFHRQSLSTNR